tara:strand:+ start:308 stop:565 length:258 start_codon:yes stop_codon:yes gene_type:complete
MAHKEINGWFEGSNGAEVFEMEGESLRTIALAMIKEFGADEVCGVDIEAEDVQGVDVSRALYDWLNSLETLGAPSMWKQSYERGA